MRFAAPTFAMPVLLALLLALLVSTPSLAQPADEQRFHVIERDDEVLRIDRQTGDVSACRDTGTEWVCRLVADDRAAYDAEINRLSAELRTAQDQLAAIRETLTDSSALVSSTARDRLGLPSDEDLGAVMDTAEEAMRRFFDMVGALRRETEAERQAR